MFLWTRANLGVARGQSGAPEVFTEQAAMRYSSGHIL